MNNTNQLQARCQGKPQKTTKSSLALLQAQPRRSPGLLQHRVSRWGSQPGALHDPSSDPASDPAGSWQVRSVGQSCQAHGDAICSCPAGTGRQPHANGVEATTGGFPSLEHLAETRLHLPHVLPGFPSPRLCLVGDAAWLLQHAADHSDTQVLIMDFDSRLVNLTAASLPTPSCKALLLCARGQLLSLLSAGAVSLRGST